ncbi:integrase core domain-containing protein [Streptomyces sp. NPDC059460]|uniref:integrase core domain-containing protein n=1 Tax=Streptomyces sp. NPDC059460 TaxID=3346840 RepID=UPI003691CBF4
MSCRFGRWPDPCFDWRCCLGDARSTGSSSLQTLRQTARAQPEAPLDIRRGINAVSEAFNSVLKVEYVHRHTFRTRAEARIRIATWITGFYNTLRLHSVCDFKSPIDYEREYWAGLTVGLAA